MATIHASGEFVRQARERLGLTRAQVAERAGCAESTIARYERHGLGGGVRFNRAAALADALGTTIGELCAARENDR